MFTDDTWQQLQYKEEVVSVKVYSGTGDDKEVSYVLVEDIQDHFQDATKFRCDGKLVNFMRDAHGKRLTPLRFAYLPGEIVQVIGPGPTKSPQQLTRQNTAVLLSTSASPLEKDRFQLSAALFEDFVKAMKNGQKEQADLIRGDFQQGFSELQAALDRNEELQRQLNDMQQHMLEMQQQALDRLAVIYGRIEDLLTATCELHEYTIPRLFIILPKHSSAWDPVSVLNNQFRLYFLCECGVHTQVLRGDSIDTPHHIHIAKHEGYDLQRPKEFFQKYGGYMLTLLEMIKYGVAIVGYVVPALSAVSASGAIDTFKNSLDTISPSAINQSIEYLQALSSMDLKGQVMTKDNQRDSLAGQDTVEGADLRHLEAFLKSKDQHRTLGNLYRTITQEGHVKWVCINHYRLAYREKDQQAFATAVELNGGRYDPRLGKVWINLGSKIRAAEFYDALVEGKRIDELDIMLDWECTTNDLEALGNTLKIAAVSILRLHLRHVRTSFGRRLLPTSTQYGVFDRIIEAPSIRMVHIVLPMDLVKLSGLQSKRLSHFPKISFEVLWGICEEKEVRRLAETLKTNSTLTTLDLSSNSIGENGAIALSEALKTNSTLTTLHLKRNSIGDNGAVALSEALNTNSTVTTLNLSYNSIGDNGAVALSETLKTNSTLTILDLRNNSIRDDGVVALSEALKTNSTLTTLDLRKNSIGDNGCNKAGSRLCGVYGNVFFQAKSTVVRMMFVLFYIGVLSAQPAGPVLGLYCCNGAVALSEALKINSTVTTLNLSYNSIGDNGAVALSEALKTNSTLTTLDLRNNSIGSYGAVALSEALKTNSTLTVLDLRNNSIGDNGA
ncbi:hypothetical protein BGX28_009996, partial [Mortierella sp. GBA30]